MHRSLETNRAARRPVQAAGGAATLQDCRRALRTLFQRCGRFFAVLGTPAALGHTFTADEEETGGPRAIVLSDALWRSRFGADSSIIGRALRIGGELRTVVGVMPASFRHPAAATEAPAQPIPALARAREARFYIGVGRLRPGVTLEQAQHDLAAVQARLGEEFPSTDRGWSVAVTSLKEEMIGGVRRSLWLLFGAVLLMLLASCGKRPEETGSRHERVLARLAGALVARRDQSGLRIVALGARPAQVVAQVMRQTVVDSDGHRRRARGRGPAGAVHGRPRVRHLVTRSSDVWRGAAGARGGHGDVALLPARRASRLDPVDALRQE